MSVEDLPTNIKRIVQYPDPAAAMAPDRRRVPCASARREYAVRIETLGYG